LIQGSLGKPFKGKLQERDLLWGVWKKEKMESLFPIISIEKWREKE
jgi:hypothetical protein